MTDRELLEEIQKEIGDHIGSRQMAGDKYLILPNIHPGKTPKGAFLGWVWPAPIWNLQRPIVSDGFNRHEVGQKGKPGYKRQHLGVDIMFKNSSARKPRLPELTKWYSMPSNVPYLAPGPGHVWFAGKTATGWTVKIDHHAWVGFPLMTYHTHMSKLFIEEWWEEEDGIYVPAGFQLGLIGNSPKTDGDPNHVHFELWDYSEGIAGGRANRCLDPDRFLPAFSWRVMYG